MKIKRARLTVYENVATGDLYYGFKIKEALIKEIEGVKYMEVTASLKHPKQMWVKLDSIKPIKEIEHNVFN